MDALQFRRISASSTSLSQDSPVSTDMSTDLPVVLQTFSLIVLLARSPKDYTVKVKNSGKTILKITSCKDCETTSSITKLLLTDPHLFLFIKTLGRETIIKVALLEGTELHTDIFIRETYPKRLIFEELKPQSVLRNYSLGKS